MNKSTELDIIKTDPQFLFDKYDANGSGVVVDVSDSSSTASKSASSDDEQANEPVVDTVAAAAQLQPAAAQAPAPPPVNWGFKGECGPTEWHKYFPHAAGKKQSPVDIPSMNAVFCEKLAKAPFKVNYDEKCTSKIENNGRIFMVTGDSPESVVTGGPADCEYKFMQFHMHWGPDNTGGSEHTIDGKQYVAEMHFVNWNYLHHGDTTAASFATDHTGLMVFGVLLTLGAENPELEKLIRSLGSVKFVNQSAPIAEPFDLNRLLPDDKASYYHYLGSLTMPPCTECVKWVVFKKPVEVSARQMDEFRTLYNCSSASECCEKTRMDNNVRPVCPLNGRTVFKSFTN